MEEVRSSSLLRSTFMTTSLQPGLDYTGVCVVYFCHDNNGQFVMALRNGAARDERGKWDIGGGMVEHGSAVEETLHKEILEEYGATVLRSTFLGYRDVHRVVDGKPSHWVALDFQVLVDAAQVHNAEPHKFDAVEWFTLETLPSTDELHSQLPIFLEKYKTALASQP